MKDLEKQLEEEAEKCLNNNGFIDGFSIMSNPQSTYKNMIKAMVELVKSESARKYHQQGMFTEEQMREAWRTERSRISFEDFINQLKK